MSVRRTADAAVPGKGRIMPGSRRAIHVAATFTAALTVAGGLATVPPQAAAASNRRPVVQRETVSEHRTVVPRRHAAAAPAKTRRLLNTSWPAGGTASIRVTRQAGAIRSALYRAGK